MGVNISDTNFILNRYLQFNRDSKVDEALRHMPYLYIESTAARHRIIRRKFSNRHRAIIIFAALHHFAPISRINICNSLINRTLVIQSCNNSIFGHGS